MSQWAEMFASNRLHPNYWVNIAIFVQIVEWFWMNALIKQWMPWSTEYHANNSIQLSSNVGSELHQYQNMYLPLSCHELWVTPRRRRARMNSLSLSLIYSQRNHYHRGWAVPCNVTYDGIHWWTESHCIYIKYQTHTNTAHEKPILINTGCIRSRSDVRHSADKQTVPLSKCITHTHR